MLITFVLTVDSTSSVERKVSGAATRVQDKGVNAIKLGTGSEGGGLEVCAEALKLAYDERSRGQTRIGEQPVEDSMQALAVAPLERSRTARIMVEAPRRTD